MAERQSSCHPIGRILIFLVAAQDVIYIAGVFAAEAHQANGQFVIHQRDVDHGRDIGVLVITVFDIGGGAFNPAAHFRGVGFVGDDAQGAGLGGIAEQGALGTTQCLHALYVDQAWVGVEASLGNRLLIQVNTRRGFGAKLYAGGGDTAKHQRCARGFAPRKGQTGDFSGVIIQNIKALALYICSGEGGDGLGQILQIGLALAGRHDDFFQGVVLGVYLDCRWCGTQYGRDH